MKVCGIVGSPKKDGNVDLLVTQVLKGANSRKVETCKIYLNDMQIKPCQSCGVDPYPKHCFFDDDMSEIYDALQTCDAVVLGSPIYFDTVSAQAKLMIDRCNCLMPYIKKPDGTYGFERRIKKRKIGILVVASGIDQEFDTIQATINGFFNWANIELEEIIAYPHADSEIGSVKSNKQIMNRAFQIGVQIAQPMRRSGPGAI